MPQKEQRQQRFRKVSFDAPWFRQLFIINFKPKVYIRFMWFSRRNDGRFGSLAVPRFLGRTISAI
jgi:predicted component of type VI protein secretion system